MKKYVCGFAFDDSLTDVLLIRKNRPAWQKDRLNGIGGLIEPDEMPSDAMAREFMEECGIRTSGRDWIPFASLSDRRGWVVTFFFTISDLSKAKTITDEVVEVVEAFGELRQREMIPNLRWLIPMAISRSTGSDPTEFFTITER